MTLSLQARSIAIVGITPFLLADFFCYDALVKSQQIKLED